MDLVSDWPRELCRPMLNNCRIQNQQRKKRLNLLIFSPQVADPEFHLDPKIRESVIVIYYLNCLVDFIIIQRLFVRSSTIGRQISLSQ